MHHTFVDYFLTILFTLLFGLFYLILFYGCAKQSQDTEMSPDNGRKKDQGKVDCLQGPSC